MNHASEVYRSLRLVAIAWNILFVFWSLRNGINEGFHGTLLEVVSYLGVMVLLLLNSFLLFKTRDSST
jgi:type IV secretory pathway TrbL component